MKKIIFIFTSLLLYSCLNLDNSDLYDSVGFEPGTRPKEYYQKQNREQITPDYYYRAPQYQQNMQQNVRQNGQNFAPSGFYPPNSRYYSNPYSFTPPPQFPFYDSDQYYTPPRAGQDVQEGYNPYNQGNYQQNIY